MSDYVSAKAEDAQDHRRRLIIADSRPAAFPEHEEGAFRSGDIGVKSMVWTVPWVGLRCRPLVPGGRQTGQVDR